MPKILYLHHIVGFIVAAAVLDQHKHIRKSSLKGECLLDKYILAEGAFMLFDGKKW
jgi:hypothetical protein